MEMFINNFWKEFEANEYRYLNEMHRSKQNFLYFPVLSHIAEAIHKDLDVAVMDADDPKIVFITKGKLQLQKYAAQIINKKPPSILFKPRIGIPPFIGTFHELDSRFNFLGEGYQIFQLYFSIIKIYKTSKKLHLNIHMQCNGSFGKYILQPIARTCLLLYLGDETYYNTVSTIKIVKRKYKKLNLFPIDQLRKF